MKLWERSLIFRLFKIVSSLLLALFVLFFFMDLSIHSARFFSQKMNPFSLIVYYLYSFSLHLDLFLALSFLLGSLAILFRASNHFELITLQMSGISRARLARPFILFALMLVVCSYINSELFVPSAPSSMDAFRDLHAKRKKSTTHLYTIPLPDGTELIYSHYAKHQLSDVYWVRGPDLWHMKTYSSGSAHCVDHFIRSSQGIELVESFFEKSFPELNDLALSKFAPPDQRPLSSLFLQAFIPTSDQHLVRTALHYKLSLPCTTLWIALILPPLLMRFSRTRPHFLITAISILLLISFLTIFDGMVILAENHMLPPALALWSPWAVVGLVTFCQVKTLKKSSWRKLRNSV